MIKVCQGCFTKIEASGFCSECRRELRSPSDLNDALAKNITSLFHYDGMLRLAIMRAKVRNDFNALRGLCELFTSDERVLAITNAADVLVPAPSSVWGRVRGRFDLAQACALMLSRETGISISFMPLWHYMRFGKRAGKNFEKFSKRDFLVSTPKARYEGKRVLLIDDVVTTGQTIGGSVAWLKSEAALSVKVVTLAAAT